MTLLNRGFLWVLIDRISSQAHCAQVTAVRDAWRRICHPPHIHPVLAQYEEALAMVQQTETADGSEQPSSFINDFVQQLIQVGLLDAASATGFDSSASPSVSPMQQNAQEHNMDLEVTCSITFSFRHTAIQRSNARYIYCTSSPPKRAV